MKIIFLDFDGVINSEKWMVSRRDKYTMDDIHNQYPFYEIDPEAVSRLNRIIEATGAKVVVSSTWRHGRTVEQLTEILKFHGFEGEIIDTTPHFGGAGKSGYTIPRGCEIDHWLEQKGFKKILWSIDRLRKKIEKSEVKNYIILDDDTDMLLEQREHFVNTHWKTGITDEDVEKSIEILNTSLEKLYYPEIDWD
jgi:hypothetical protein